MTGSCRVLFVGICAVVATACKTPNRPSASSAASSDTAPAADQLESSDQSCWNTPLRASIVKARDALEAEHPKTLTMGAFVGEVSETQQCAVGMFFQNDEEIARFKAEYREKHPGSDATRHGDIPLVYWTLADRKTPEKIPYSYKPCPAP